MPMSISQRKIIIFDAKILWLSDMALLRIKEEKTMTKYPNLNVRNCFIK